MNNSEKLALLENTNQKGLDRPNPIRAIALIKLSESDNLKLFHWH